MRKPESSRKTEHRIKGREHKMKVRYDVARSDATGCFWSRNQRESFEMAKKVAMEDRFGLAFMTRLLWDESGRITVSTVAVRADGSFNKIN